MLTKIHEIQDKKVLKTIGYYAFILALFMEALIVLADKSALMNPFEGRLFQLTFILCCVKVLFTKYDLKEYIFLALFCVLGLAVDYFGDRNEILRFVILVAACKDVDIRKILKMLLWIYIFGCTILALLSVFGVYGPLTVPKEYQGIGFIDRYCFGMGNANSFHTMFFVIVLLALYLYYKQLKWWGYLVLALANGMLYMLTDSRTSTAMVFLSIIAFGLIKFKDGTLLKNKCIATVFTYACLFINAAMVGLSIWFAAGARRYNKYYWDSFWEDPPNPPRAMIFFDKLLTGRILSLTEYDFHGAIESWRWFTVPDHTVYFDLGFVRLFYWYGIIPATILLLVFAILIVYLIRKEKYTEVLLLTFVSIYTLVEAHFVSVYIGRCYPLLILGMYAPKIVADIKISKKGIKASNEQ